MKDVLRFEDNVLAAHFIEEWNGVREQVRLAEELLAKAGGDFDELKRMRKSGEALLGLVDVVANFDEMISAMGVEGEKAKEAKRMFLDALGELASSEGDEKIRTDKIKKRVKEILVSLLTE